MAKLNDRDWVLSDGLSLCTEDFVRYDRRRLTAQPPADRQGWRDAMLDFEELAGGRWPMLEVTETVAVQGRRLAATRWMMNLGDSGEFESIVVTRCNERVDKMEVTYYFGPEQLDEALAELDRQQSAIIGDDEN